MGENARKKEKRSDEAVFLKRLNEHMDELKWLYMELYEDEGSFEALIQMLSDSFGERPAALKDLDRAREEDPSWYRTKDMLGMILYTDCFAEDLKGLKKHLGYIEECGVNLIHLMPLLESPEGRSDGGYAVSDFRKVQPALGTMEELAEVAALCHEKEIRLCLDFVMNHTSEDHEWARRAKRGQLEYQDRYFFYPDWEIPDQFEQTMPEVFPTTAPGNFTWCEEAGKVVMTTFYPYQWDLNYRNPVVLCEMTANLLYLCNQGIDIIRLDAVPYIWKTLGTNCRNLKEVHSLTRILHLAVEIVCPGTLLLGEVVMEPVEVVPYFGKVGKPECDMLYNVTTMCTMWHTVATKDVRLLRDQLDKVFALPKEYCFLNYLRCHDDIGWGLDYEFLKQFGQLEIPHKRYLNDYFCGNYPDSDARGELYNDDPRLKDARLCGTTASLVGIEAAEYERDQEKLNRAIRYDLMLHAFLLTLRGLPILYGGDEIGQLNDYSYHGVPGKREDSRYIHRGRRSWEETALRRLDGSRQEKIFTGLKKLEQIRAAYDVFLDEADCETIDLYNDSVLGIKRQYGDQTLYGLFHFGTQDVTVGVDDAGEKRNLLTGEVSKGDRILVPAGDFLWLLSGR
ncbi:MAG: alpha-amylase family protein [Eubacterium sp.]|nr:alpha-amylase family protein [Eubacterium sp.]